MKKLILAAALLLSVTVAEAGTVYRDRFLPAGAPCMITFGERSINATMIKEVELTDFTEIKEVHFFTAHEYRTYRALRVTMINGGWYQITSGNLEHAQAGLMSQINDCRK
jgi:hypothetical protein